MVTDRRWVVALVAPLMVAAAMLACAPPVPARADCGTQGPSRAIAGHLGFALEGIVSSVEGRDVPIHGWLYRVVVDVSEMLAGEPVDRLAFDLGTGDCWQLQGDRYKVGDRLIVTASGPPTEGEVAYLPDALTWRYEWADRWSFHGLTEQVSATLSRAIREASTRDEILALVAPDRLPYEVAPGAWPVTLARPGTAERLRDVVPWGDGFVALGGRVAHRHEGARERTVPTIWLSATGRHWQRVRSPFPDVVTPDSSVSRLVAFRDRLYAVGMDGHTLRVWRSRDGTRWSPVDIGNGSDASGSTARSGARRAVVGVAATDERMVILTGPWSGDGGADAAWTTTGARTWSRSVTDGLGGPVADLVPGPDGFLVRSCRCSRPDERWVLRASVDGVAWTEVGALPPHSYGVAFDDARQRHIAATLEVHEDDRTIGALDASADGVTWSRVVTSPGTETNQVGVAASGDTIVLLASRYAPDDEGSLVMWSRDGGATWALTVLRGARQAECVTKVAVGASAMVAVGGCAGRLAWTSRP